MEQVSGGVVDTVCVQLELQVPALLHVQLNIVRVRVPLQDVEEERVHALHAP